MKCLHYNTLLMTIGGVYKIETDNPIKRVLFTFWRLIVNLTMLFLIISTAKSLWESEFKSTVINYAYLMAGVATWIQMTYLVIYDDESYDLVKEMRSLFKYRTDIGFVEKDLGFYINLTNKITLASVFGIFLLGQSFVLISSIINRNSRKLSMPIWCIIDCKISPYYEMAVFLEMFLDQIYALTMIAADAFFVSSIILLGAQFQLLGWELKHVLYKTLFKQAVSLDIVLSYTSQFPDIQATPLGKYYDSAEFKNELMENLNELIEFYGSLVNLCTRVNDFFSPRHFTNIGTLLADAVFMGHYLIITEDLFLRIECMMYLIAVLFTIFIPCYFGNLLTSQAEEFIHELYDSPWYTFDYNFRTNFKMLQQSACRPIRFTIGKFGILSLSTFVGIMRAGMSYLAVLRQITRDS